MISQQKPKQITLLNFPLYIQQILNNQVAQMSALSDLQAAATAIVAAVQTAIPLLQQAASSGAVSASDVEAVVSELNTATQALSTAETPPPPPPAS